MHVIRGTSAAPQRSSAPIFQGEVHMQALVGPDVAAHLRMGLVRFSAGARTRWHTHSFEQGLYITEGRGIVATAEAEHVVTPGDIAIIPAGERHWHGGTLSTAMAHISITTPGETTVLEPVTEVRTTE